MTQYHKDKLASAQVRKVLVAKDKARATSILIRLIPLHSQSHTLNNYGY